MAIATCSIQGNLIGPDGNGITGILYIEYNASGSIANSDGSYSRVVPNVSKGIFVNNGVITPTDIIPSTDTSESVTVTATLISNTGTTLFKEQWLISGTNGIFDVGNAVGYAQDTLSFLQSLIYASGTIAGTYAKLLAVLTNVVLPTDLIVQTDTQVSDVNNDS
ncbi:MAG: hypothetical protein ACRYGG_23280 [Janthinobacterium lividum]